MICLNVATKKGRVARLSRVTIESSLVRRARDSESAREYLSKRNNYDATNVILQAELSARIGDY